jgi:hypothetical protein
MTNWGVAEVIVSVGGGEMGKGGDISRLALLTFALVLN